MKPMLLLLCVLYSFVTYGAYKDSIATTYIADSVRALSFYTELPLALNYKTVKRGYAEIKVDGIALRLQKQKRGHLDVAMYLPEKMEIVASGLSVQRVKRAMLFETPDTGTYKLMLVKAFDSVANFSLVSGYAFLPNLQKWKLIGTVRQGGYGYISSLHMTSSIGKKKIVQGFTHTAVQRANGSWRSLEGALTATPTINWLSEPDSAERASLERDVIQEAITRKDLIGAKAHDGIFYLIEQMGTGRQVKVSDTVSVYYRGHVLGDTTVFDQTAAGKPARFPLARLIRGWQIGLPLIKEGGKTRLIIPSGLAYSIRTRSPKIPPNSILVFDVEVLKLE